MKKILLLGDSIRMGYDTPVKEKLSGIAQVFFPEDNCRFAQYTLCNLHHWANEIGCVNEIDLIHWNNGLWDVGHYFNCECLTPPDTYGMTLRKIYKVLGILFPKAKVIFALSTAVIENRQNNPDYNTVTCFRHNKEIMEYNSIAGRITNELNAELNDLYKVSVILSEDYYVDGVHFTGKGYDILADAVAKKCESCL